MIVQLWWAPGNQPGSTHHTGKAESTGTQCNLPGNENVTCCFTLCAVSAKGNKVKILMCVTKGRRLMIKKRSY